MSYKQAALNIFGSTDLVCAQAVIMICHDEDSLQNFDYNVNIAFQTIY